MRWFLPGLALALLVTVPVVAQPVINEINYDDYSIDFEEYLEIYAAGGGDYSAYDVVLYNGSTGLLYNRINLGTVPADGYLVIGNAGVPNVDITELPNFLQNGSPDGIAIVSGGACLQFLSYEGTFQAVGDECDGVTSTDIGVADAPSGSAANDQVIQRIPNITGMFTLTGDGTTNGVIADGTPGLPNAAGPNAVGKLTTLAQDGGAVTVELCAADGQPPYTYYIQSLPAHGDLRNGATLITTTPYGIAGASIGNLNYTPDAAYSGLDTFTWSVTDSQPLSSATVTQELGVQTDSVVISEIMHTPSLEDSLYEFVEIYNHSASAVTLSSIDTRPETTIDTTNNLNVSIPANTMKIIAIDATTNGAGYGLDQFLCEWRLTESDIIRVNVNKWEFMFSAPDPFSCNASAGSRVLLFGAGGVLLDAVDIGIYGIDNCVNTSYAVDGFELFGDPLTSITNDDLIWFCSGQIPEGQRQGDISQAANGPGNGDLASPGYVPYWKESMTYQASCFGACCLTNGDCVDGLSATECADQRCGLGGGWSQGAVCDTSHQSACAAQADTDQKCCLPTGTCVPAGECECIQLNGDYDGGTTCGADPFCPAVTLVINELEYDSPGTDADEFVELFGDPGQDLAGWSLALYNGNPALTGDNIYGTVDLALSPGGQMPLDGYLVVGSATVPNVDLVAWTDNGLQNGSPGGDGIVLLFNNEVVEALSYASGTTGFSAVGGPADGTFLPDIGVVDSASTTLQKIPDAGTWTATTNNTPGATNFDGGNKGACCNTATYECIEEYPEDCTSAGFEFQGLGTTCQPTNPCIPTGSCCLPDGVCVNNVSEDGCVNILGGVWNGADSVCPNTEAFIPCLSDTGPGTTAAGACADWDLDADLDVDLRDFALMQPSFCASDPVGACCPPSGMCEEITQYECDMLGGDYRGDGVLCDGLTPPCDEVVPGTILINEIWADDPGGDDNEFIELYGPASTSLNGYSLIIVEGETGGDTMSPAYRRVNFRADFNASYALDAGGYFLMGGGPGVTGADVDLDATFGDGNGVLDEIQNGSQTYALVQTSLLAYCTSTGVPDAYCTDAGDQLTQASVDAIEAATMSATGDAVATRYGLFDSYYFHAPLVQDSGFYAFDYGQRIPNGTDTNAASDWETTYGYELGDPGDPSTPGSANISQSSIAGACCLDGGCQEVLDTDCAATNGLFLGYGTTCSPNPCGCGSIEEVGYITYPDTGYACITGAIITNTYTNLGSANSKTFNIQDPTGTRAMAVYGPNADIDALLAIAGEGDEIEIRGTRQEYFGLQEFSVALGPIEVTYLSSPGVPAPTPLSIATLKDAYTGTADPRRAYIATLAVITNAEFAAGDQGGTFSSGFNYTIHDATTPTDTMILYIPNAGLPIVGTTIPSGAVDIVGIIGTYNNNFEIHPHEPGDITAH